MTNIETDKPWRPFEPCIEKRYFIADQAGNYWWVGVARDRRHFIELLGEQGAEFEAETEIDPVGIRDAIAMGIVTVRELGAEEVARRQRCHTEDERGVIPLAEAAIGDLFCSEW